MAVYTTKANITTRISQIALDLRDDHEAVPDAVVDHAITWASSQIDFYCARYPASSLVSNAWIQSVTTDLAVFYLASYRYNPAPASAGELYEEAKEKLQLIQQGKAVVPNAAAGRDSLPTVTHQRVDLNRYPSLVTERPRSTGEAEGYRRPVDHTADLIDRR
jgi:phage gp36-like protein